MSYKYEQTLLLDSSYLPKNVISSDRAIVIFYKGRGQVLREHPKKFGLVRKDIDIYRPSVIRIQNYIPMEYKNVPLSRKNIFERDDYTCIYCNKRRKSIMTIDHIIPQSKGGKNTWENLITACRSCNGEKADLSLEEFGKIIPVPKRPHALMLMKKVNHIPKEWEEYLFY